jgi:hypothetical protein
LGSFNFTMTGSETETAPRTQTTMSTAMGVLTVTTGKTSDYVVVLSQNDTGPCVLEAKNERNEIVMTSGQQCTFAGGGGTRLTATLTSGSIVRGERGEAITVNVAYTYTAMVVLNFVGSGTRTYAGTRR